MLTLPVDSLLPEIVATLGRAQSLVVEAPPGAGKTTRVPGALLDAGMAGEREVWVLEPRRMAARLAARRVAEERGESLGETVGYQVRFEEVAGPRTRLRFLTEGVFTRRLLADEKLTRAGVVVLDEFHERHLQGDLALALLRRLQRGARPDLKVVVMSATLDARPVAEFLGGCPTLRSEGRLFEVKVEHAARHEDEALGSRVAAAVARVVGEERDGDVLVFLPGAAEIRRAAERLAALAARHDLLVLPLHGELPLAEQDRAVRPAARRKVILSTNVAESSVTIDGVVAVVDSGLARAAGHSPWSGLPTLGTTRVSRASAAQRAGRAGRTRPGRCLRLYTAQDFAARPEHETPEIERADLAEAALELHASGVADLRAFQWFEPPPAAALDAAEELLQRLGALDSSGVTARGARMLRLPLHPRLARVVTEGESRGVAEEACAVAALAGERDIRARELFSEGGTRETRNAKREGPSDLLELLDLFDAAARADFAPPRLYDLNLNPHAVRRVERARMQIRRQLRATMKDAVREGAAASKKVSDGARGGDREEALLISILTGYPDRVARRRASGEAANNSGAELLLAGGGAATLAPESVVRRAQFLVAVDAEERREAAQRQGRAGGTVIRTASAIEPEWLLDLYAERIAETTEVEWNARAERVETIRRLVYDKLVLDERRASEAGGDEAARVLARAALDAGLDLFVERKTLDNFLARVAFVSATFPEAGVPEFNEDDAREALRSLCEGLGSFEELRAAARGGGLVQTLRHGLKPEHARLLTTAAPERVTLARGRQARVNYERGKPPWVASRLQDFFGMREGPRVAGGRVALVLHLLAPNQRPVQVTTDLAGFWARHYQQIRRELSRRYPRHAWPEDPLAAEL
ncbi:MAG TPA: ATP-dependent helicase HrpB [Pyrinomonadaceae bacterium]|nr:ATP-dependent helicase HrpB [Pyrinomonadaceae bacterium]